MDRFSGVAIGAVLIALSIPMTLAMTFGMMDVVGIDVQQVSIAALAWLGCYFSSHVPGLKTKDRAGPDRTRKGAFEAARSKVAADSATIAAAQAEIQRLQTQLNDRDLKAPVRARVLYKVAEPGEDQ